MSTNVNVKLKKQLRTAAERARRLDRSKEPNQARKSGYSAKFI